MLTNEQATYPFGARVYSETRGFGTASTSYMHKGEEVTCVKFDRTGLKAFMITNELIQVLCG